MFTAVLAGTAHELVVVLLELQGRFHLQVCQPPVPVLVVEIVAAVLVEHPNRLRWRGADKRRVDVPTPDVRETLLIKAAS